MQQILNGKKEVLLKSEVNSVKIPTFPELSVERLLEKVEGHSVITSHLPDVGEKKSVDKAFLWHILNYFSPKFVEQATQEANKLRMEARMEQTEKRKPLQIKPEILDRMKRLQLFRSKWT